jgi:hypothetical protein
VSFRGRIVRISQLIADSITGAVITGGTINGTTINGGTIVGAVVSAATVIGGTLETAASGARWVLEGVTDAQTMTAFSGLAAEVTPAFIQVFNFASHASSLFLSSADMTNGPPTGGSSGVATLEIAAAGVGTAPGGRASINMRFPARGGLSLNGSDGIRETGVGSWSGTTDGSGQIAGLSHRCSEPPTAILVNQVSGSGQGRVRCIAIGTNLFTVQINNTVTGAAFAAGSAFSGTFIAIVT